MHSARLKMKIPIYRVFGLLTFRISPLRMLGRVEFQRITVAFPNFQFSIFNILAKGLPRGVGRKLADSTKHYFARTKHKIFYT